MSFSEVVPVLQALSRADKLQAIQFLAAELARDEVKNLLKPGMDYPIWSPYDAQEAAQELLNLLEKERVKP